MSKKKLKKKKKNGERLKCFARVDPYSISSMASYNGQKRSRIFTSSREYFCRVGNIFAESRIFLPSREYFCLVENNFFMSNSDNQSKIFSGVEIFLSNRNFFIESRIPNMSCRHLPPK